MRVYVCVSSKKMRYKGPIFMLVFRGTKRIFETFMDAGSENGGKNEIFRSIDRQMRYSDL